MSKQDWIGKKLTNGDGGPEVGQIIGVNEDGQFLVTIYGKPGTFIFRIDDVKLK